MDHGRLLPDLGLLLLAALGGGTVAYLCPNHPSLGTSSVRSWSVPFTPGPQLSNPQAFETFADIGVVLLMFSLGAEFSLQELLRVRKAAMFGAPARHEACLRRPPQRWVGTWITTPRPSGCSSAVP
jgi:predicted Kef-type K+ transport protein